MKRFFTFLLICCITISAQAQKIKGQWRGYFNSKGDIVLSGNDASNTEYVLELEINGTAVSGYSYSYFNNRAYYVICSLKGEYNKSTKIVTVTETSKVKSNTPPPPFWSDCLQTHILHYEKQGNIEVLTGKWRSANSEVSDCGVGNTTLTRKTLSNNLASYNKSQNRTPVATVKKPATTKVPNIVAKTKPKTAPVIASIDNTVKPAVTEPIAKKEDLTPKTTVPDKKEPATNDLDDFAGFEKRDNDVLKTITIDNEDFKVSLYDNGDIDGDSVSLFYNGKLLLAHKRLGITPITLTLDATTDRDTNELTMYAENLGEIPPNTALMIVNDGDKRYEVRIASDLKKSGTIRFVHRSKTP